MLHASDPSPLRLVGAANGIEFDGVVVEKQELRVRAADGTTQPVPRGITWRLDGDLRANSRALFYGPSYEIVTRELHPLEMHRRTGTFAIVRAYRDWPWTDRQLDRGCVAIFLWLVDGRVTWVEAKPMPDSDGPSGAFVGVATVELDATTRRGAPAVALLGPDGLIAPRPWFRDENAQSALSELQLGTAESFAQAASQMKSVQTRAERYSLTLMHFVADSGSSEAVQRLIALEGRTDVQNSSGSTPLKWAVKDGRLENVATILASTPGSRVSKGIRATLRDLALEQGHLDVALTFLTDRPNDLRGLLQLALVQTDLDAVRHLLAAGAESQVRRMRPDDFLRVLATGDGDIAQALLAAGMEAQAKPLLVAAAAGRNPAVVAALLAAGADSNQAADDGTSALMIAARNGDAKIVTVLVDAGATAEAQNRRGETARTWADVGGDPEVRALLAGVAMPAVDISPGARDRKIPDATAAFFDWSREPILNEADVDLPPAALESRSPDVLRSLNVEYNSIHSTVTTANPYTGQVVERRVVAPMISGASPTANENHWAVVSAVVEPDGRPRFIQVVDGVSEPFEIAVRKAMEESRFQPGMVDGKPVRTRILRAITVDE